MRKLLLSLEKLLFEEAIRTKRDIFVIFWLQLIINVRLFIILRFFNELHIDKFNNMWYNYLV